MDRPTLPRTLLQFLAVAAWLFLAISLGSFSSSDWPSHEVYPYPPTQNLCGSVGALVAYYSFLAIGHGVFPILFFSGVCIVLFLMDSRVGDLWIRAAGLLVLAIAFAAAVHNIRPGSAGGFPEGNGGLLGIAASSYLQAHLNTVGTRLILLVAMLTGLLLAADELVLRAPRAVGTAIGHARTTSGSLRLAIPSIAPFGPNSFERSSSASSGSKAKPSAAAPKFALASSATDDDPDSESIGWFRRLQSRFQRAGQSATARLRPDPVGQRTPQSLDAELDAMDRELDELQASPVLKRDRDDEEDVELHYENDHTFVDGSEDDPAAEQGTIPDPSAGPPLEIRKEIVVKLPSMLKPRQVSPQPAQPKELGEYNLPQWEFLAEAEHGYAEQQEQFVREQAAILEQALREFDIDAHVVEIDTGPVITMYELALAPGIKVSAISALSNDVQRSLKAETVRIVAPIPGKSTVGIEVPNSQKEKVRLKELMQLAPDALAKDFMIPLFLGKDASGEPIITDLTKMPHCLIAGTTGSGKSVCINTIIMSVMYLQRPDMVKLILIDPKVVEMAPFKEIPHLMCPVINDAARATSVLEWACTKMDERYDLLAEAGVRNIKDYNRLTREELVEKFQCSTPEEEAKVPKKLPYIVVIIDELADLMMTSGKEVESFIVRIAQKARAVGIHLIVATQRPQATVVTGLIKSNLPSKIAFRVSSKMDSRIVLDQNGADLLLGQGDMLFLPPGASKPTRGQGTFIDDKEIRESVKLVKSLAEAQFEPELVQIKAGLGDAGDMEKDDLFDDAVRVVLESRRGSVSLLQRKLTIGYSRASRLIEAMANAGIVGDYKGSQAREAQITLDEWEAMKTAQQDDGQDGMSV